MKTCWVLLVCIVIAATVAYVRGADQGYQPARVASIDHIPADARHPEKADHYKVAVRLADTVYPCPSSAPPSAFLDRSPNKDFPAKLDGKMPLVNGQHARVTLNITGKKRRSKNKS